MLQHSTLEKMKTLAACLDGLIKEGYTDNFRVNEKGLYSPESDRTYSPEQTKIIDFYRFEGASDPDDNSILYVIETSDGSEGTLTDAYGPYADPLVSKFIRQVSDISKAPQTPGHTT